MIVTKEILKIELDRECCNYEKGKIEAQNYGFKDTIKRKYFEYLSGNKQWNPPTEKIKINSLKRVLIFRYDAIGDYIVTRSAIRWLKAANPNIKIDIITSNRNHQLAVNDPYINEAYEIPYSSGFSFSMFKIKKVRKDNYYDLVLALIFSKNTKSALMAKLAAPDAEKMTILHHKRASIHGLMFNRLAEASVPGLSWAEKMLKCVTDIIEPNGIIPEKETHPYIVITQKNLETVSKLNSEFGIGYKLNTDNILFSEGCSNSELEGKKYIVINIAGTVKYRILSNEKVISIAKAYRKLFPDFHIFISGGPAFRTNVNEIINVLNDAHSTALDIKLSDFIAVCAGAYFVVTPDTGVVHFAAAAKVPLLIFFVELHVMYNWFPHNTKYIALVSPNKESINYVPDEEITEGTKMLINLIEEKE